MITDTLAGIAITTALIYGGSDQATALQIARVHLQCSGERADVSDMKNFSTYARALANTQEVIDQAQRAVDAEKNKS